ncbi:hypothetical protein SteCoe_17681 [Stentor coeruleus]|uniref:LITAF domain-containing protein n=1 Tax=Stentor coeruleus TaxID=5963 RepID=A0A1R2BYS5_9CILI|nr:hypothetical protein SteCoe_17681 [Stentor coeruleus]
MISSSSFPRGSSSNKYPHVEYSEEPHFSLYHHNDTKFPLDKQDSYHADTCISTEMNSSSLQTSTIQSLNLKKSFNLNSPKNSVPQAPALLSIKSKKLKKQNLHQKVEKRLQKLELQNRTYKKFEIPESKSIFDINVDKYNPVIKESDDNISFEGNEDMKIPQLIWCASCGGEVMTKIEYINTEKTLWAAMGILFSGGILGCFLIPYMTNTCKGVRLRCHKCDRILK